LARRAFGPSLDHIFHFSPEARQVSETPDLPDTEDADEAETPWPKRLADVDWDRVFKALVAFGVRRMRLRPPDAEQTAAEAIGRQFDPDYATWDPETEPNVLIYLFGVMRGIGGSERQRKGFQAERITRKGELPRVAVDEPSAEEALVVATEAQEAIAALRARARADEPVLLLIELRLRGVDTPAEQARALGMTAYDVKQIQKRLDRHVTAIKALREAH
jgi:hypothetical protein